MSSSSRSRSNSNARRGTPTGRKATAAAPPSNTTNVSVAKQSSADKAGAIGKAELLAWASTETGVKPCLKYDDLRDGLVFAILAERLFPHLISSSAALYTQRGGIRNAKLNWDVIHSVVTAAGLPATICDRRAISAGHQRPCYNALVMFYFLSQLDSHSDFTVDFAHPIDDELASFLQSTRSLEALGRSHADLERRTRSHSSIAHTILPHHRAEDGSQSTPPRGDRRAPRKKAEMYSRASNGARMDDSSFDDEYKIGTAAPSPNENAARPSFESYLTSASPLNLVSRGSASGARANTDVGDGLGMFGSSGPFGAALSNSFVDFDFPATIAASSRVTSSTPLRSNNPDAPTVSPNSRNVVSPHSPPTSYTRAPRAPSIASPLSNKPLDHSPPGTALAATSSVVSGWSAPQLSTIGEVVVSRLRGEILEAARARRALEREMSMRQARMELLFQHEQLSHKVSMDKMRVQNDAKIAQERINMQWELQSSLRWHDDAFARLLEDIELEKAHMAFSADPTTSKGDLAQYDELLATRKICAALSARTKAQGEQIHQWKESYKQLEKTVAAQQHSMDRSEALYAHVCRTLKARMRETNTPTFLGIESATGPNPPQESEVSSDELESVLVTVPVAEQYPVIARLNELQLQLASEVTSKQRIEMDLLASQRESRELRTYVAELEHISRMKFEEANLVEATIGFDGAKGSSWTAHGLSNSDDSQTSRDHDNPVLLAGRRELQLVRMTLECKRLARVNAFLSQQLNKSGVLPDQQPPNHVKFTNGAGSPNELGAGGGTPNRRPLSPQNSSVGKSLSGELIAAPSTDASYNSQLQLFRGDAGSVTLTGNLVVPTSSLGGTTLTAVSAAALEAMQHLTKLLSRMPEQTARHNSIIRDDDLHSSVTHSERDSTNVSHYAQSRAALQHLTTTLESKFWALVAAAKVLQERVEMGSRTIGALQKSTTSLQRQLIVAEHSANAKMQQFIRDTKRSVDDLCSDHSVEVDQLKLQNRLLHEELVGVRQTVEATTHHLQAFGHQLAEDCKRTMLEPVERLESLRSAVETLKERDALWEALAEALRVALQSTIQTRQRGRNPSSPPQGLLEGDEQHINHLASKLDATTPTLNESNVLLKITTVNEIQPFVRDAVATLHTRWDHGVKQFANAFSLGSSLNDKCATQGSELRAAESEVQRLKESVKQLARQGDELRAERDSLLADHHTLEGELASLRSAQTLAATEFKTFSDNVSKLLTDMSHTAPSSTALNGSSFAEKIAKKTNGNNNTTNKDVPPNWSNSLALHVEDEAEADDLNAVPGHEDIRPESHFSQYASNGSFILSSSKGNFYPGGGETNSSFSLSNAQKRPERELALSGTLLDKKGHNSSSMFGAPPQQSHAPPLFSGVKAPASLTQLSSGQPNYVEGSGGGGSNQKGVQDTPQYLNNSFTAESPRGLEAAHSSSGGQQQQSRNSSRSSKYRGGGSSGVGDNTIQEESTSPKGSSSSPLIAPGQSPGQHETIQGRSRAKTVAGARNTVPHSTTKVVENASFAGGQKETASHDSRSSSPATTAEVGGPLVQRRNSVSLPFHRRPDSTSSPLLNTNRTENTPTVGHDRSPASLAADPQQSLASSTSSHPTRSHTQGSLVARGGTAASTVLSAEELEKRKADILSKYGFK